VEFLRQLNASLLSGLLQLLLRLLMVLHDLLRKLLHLVAFGFLRHLLGELLLLHIALGSFEEEKLIGGGVGVLRDLLELLHHLLFSATGCGGR